MPTLPATDRALPAASNPARTAAHDLADAVLAVARRPLVRLTAVYTGLAVVAMLLNHPRFFVGDNVFAQYWAPDRVLARHGALWDPHVGLGKPGAGYFPFSAAVTGLFRAVGASPALAERLWHAGLLVTAGVGMVVLLRAFRPGIGLAHVFAGLVYMFNPVTVIYLLPSALFINYALAPWFLVCLVLGLREPRRWRFPAGFALLIFTAGAFNPPALLYALVPLVPATAYFVWVERSATPWSVIQWLSRSLVLSIVVSAAAIVVTMFNAGLLLANLGSSESVSVAGSASSWAESWRGMGFWVTYLNAASGHSNVTAFLQSRVPIAVTFAAPIVASLVVWRSRWRPRLLFAGVAMTALVLMVGGYPPDDPSPFGRALVRGFDAAGPLSSLRNTYKAGPGLAMGIAVLVGVGLAGAVSWVAARDRRLTAVVAVGATAALVVASFPFWTGRLYGDTARMRGLPGYWSEAINFLNGDKGTGRVLIVPGSTKTAYRWGSVNDDIFDGLLDHPHVVRTAFNLSSATADNLIRVLDRTIASPAYEPGTLAPIAKRLGITLLVIRNDLDWGQTGAPRPSALENLRHDPDLHRVATFGRPGQNVLTPGDTSFGAYLEGNLPPVEIYGIRGTSPPLRAEPLERPLIVAGDGAAWPQLSATGALDREGPVRYAAEIPNRELASLLMDGSQLVVTDTNRRRLTLFSSSDETTSHTLAAGEDLGRAPGGLFGRPLSESVADYTDAKRITASSIGNPLAGFQPWLRPAAAFDGNADTAWVGSGLMDPVGSWIRVDLKRPSRMHRVQLVASPLLGSSRRATRATIEFSDGSQVPVDLGDGQVVVAFRPRRVRWFKLRIDAVKGEGSGPVGFSEIAVSGLDLREAIVVPTDVFARARRDAALRRVLPQASVIYEFQRATGTGDQPEERGLRRRFPTVGKAGFAVDGVLTLTQTTPEPVLDVVAGGTVGARGSSRWAGFETRGALAVDGNPETGWSAAAEPGQALTVRFPEHAVRTVRVVGADDPGHSAIDEVEVMVGNHVQQATLAVPSGCSDCRPEAVLEFPPTTAAGLVVKAVIVDPKPGPLASTLPLQIAEVEVNDVINEPSTPEERRTVCLGGLLRIDAKDVPLQVTGSVGQLLGFGRPFGPEPVPFRNCEPLGSKPGDHLLTTPATVMVDQVRLRAVVPRPVATKTEPVRYQRGAFSAVDAEITARSRGPVVIRSGMTYDRSWRATAGGRDLGRPVSLDTTSAWVVKGTGSVRVHMRFAPQVVYRAALVVTALGCLLCLGLVFEGRRVRGSTP